MILAITTTHAIPQKLLPARIHVVHARVTICHHCFQVLGSAKTSAERQKLEAEHICKEKLNDLKPAAAIPFS
jgi:hypothetical protein